MKKYILIVLMSVFVIASCEVTPSDEQNEPPESGQSGDDDYFNKGSDDSGTDTSGDDGVADISSEVGNGEGFQRCQTNLVSSVWVCEKAGESQVTYFLNQAPSRIDDVGTANERRRLCELSVNNQDPTTYAHNTRYHCIKRLNEELSDRQDEGFVCTGTPRFDESRPADEC